MKFAYADPPYIGQAKRHYSHDPRCAEIDHTKLIAELAQYDGGDHGRRISKSRTHRPMTLWPRWLRRNVGVHVIYRFGHRYATIRLRPKVERCPRCGGWRVTR